MLTCVVARISQASSFSNLAKLIKTNSIQNTTKGFDICLTLFIVQFVSLLLQF